MSELKGVLYIIVVNNMLHKGHELFGQSSFGNANDANKTI